MTLFGPDGELDVPATADHAARLVGLGVGAVVVAGSTGEASALTHEERTLLLTAVRAAVPAATPVIAGTGAPSAREAAVLTAAAADHGAGAVLVLSPPGVADPRPYYDTVAKAAGATPVLAYHWPAMSAPGFPVSLLPDLPVAGAKDSSGDAGRLLEALTTYTGAVYTGSSALLAFAGPVGCSGAILALANADPEGCIAAWSGDPQAQLALAAHHRESVASFPSGVKLLTAARFGTSPTARLG